MTYEIQLSKGTYSVDLHSDNVNEEYTNKLITLVLAQTSRNQGSGKKQTKILDLLRITHQFVIRAYIAANSTKTAKEQKDDLKSIANGGGETGGVVSMVYDGDTYEGYLQKITMSKSSRDSPDTESESEIKYDLSITFVVGEAV